VRRSPSATLHEGNNVPQQQDGFPHTLSWQHQTCLQLARSGGHAVRAAHGTLHTAIVTNLGAKGVDLRVSAHTNQTNTGPMNGSAKRKGRAGVPLLDGGLQVCKGFIVPLQLGVTVGNELQCVPRRLSVIPNPNNRAPANIKMHL